MAATESFDVTSGVDLQEVDNAINQATKEISQRYDFKGQKAEIEVRPQSREARARRIGRVLPQRHVGHHPRRA